MNARKLAVALSISALSLLAACGNVPRRNETVSNVPAPYSQAVQFGRVSNIEVVSRESRASGGGAVLGAVLGAVVGNQVGSGSGRAAATGLGAIGGAVIGNNIERRNDGGGGSVYRVSVRLDNGATQQFDYERIDDVRVGDRVRLEGGQLYRA